MHAIRSLILLCCLAPLSFGQAPKTKPGAAVTVRMISIDDADWPKFKTKIAQTESCDATASMMPLSPEGLKRTLKNLESNKSINIMVAPKATMANRQELNISVGQEIKFVTAIDRKQSDGGKEMHVPQIETMLDGLSLTMTPTISADAQTIQLRLDATYSKLKPVVPLFPVTYYVTPEFDGGSQGVPVPMTQFVQKPNFDKCSVQTTVSLADATATIIDFGTIDEEIRMEYGPPIVSEIPYINRLFKNQGIGKVKKRLLLIPSVAIVPVDAVLEPMADYQRAVKQGRLNDAKKHALEALAIDPACFAK